MEDKYLTIDEVSKMLRVNKRTVYRLATKGEIPAFKFGKSWRISSIGLDKLFKQNNEK